MKERRKERRVDGWMDGYIGKWMDGCLGGWIGGWMDSGWIEFSTLPVQAMPFIVIFPHLRIVK